MFTEYLKQYRGSITEANLNNGICFDGAVNQIEYFKRDKRLAFLLKETNGNKNNGERNEVNTDWNYMEWVQKQADGEEGLYRSVFRNIAMWSRMFELYGEGTTPDIDEFIDDNGLIVNKNLCKALERIAIVNLKKSWGVEQTDWNAMNTYLGQDVVRRNILLRQMDVLQPTIVLCGGTFDFAHKIFGEGTTIQNVVGCYGIPVEFFQKGECIFVKCYHPSRPGWSRVDSYKYMDNIFRVFL